MKLVDANVLLYAVDANAEHHRASKRWLDDALNGAESVLMPWLSIVAFIRLITSPSIFARPLGTEAALDIVEGWTTSPVVVTGDPDARHVERLRELLKVTGRGGNLVNDAHLAAMALQHGAEVVTFDNDFGRFPGVVWRRPDASD